MGKKRNREVISKEVISKEVISNFEFEFESLSFENNNEYILISLLNFEF